MQGAILEAPMSLLVADEWHSAPHFGVRSRPLSKVRCDLVSDAKLSLREPILVQGCRLLDFSVPREQHKLQHHIHITNALFLL